MHTDDHTSEGLRFPILQGVLPVKATQLPAEILAGLTLAALAIPEVMGYTKIAGTPVITGLYTMLLPMLLFALFGSSRHLVVSADSATAAILAAGLVGLAAPGSEAYVALTGVGLQVALGEVAGMVGLKGGGHGTLQKLWNVMQQLADLNGYALATALSVLAVIVGAKRVSQQIPGALIAVVGAILVSWALGLQAHLPVLGPVPSGLPHLAFPVHRRNFVRQSDIAF